MARSVFSCRLQMADTSGGVHCSTPLQCLFRHLSDVCPGVWGPECLQGSGQVSEPAWYDSAIFSSQLGVGAILSNPLLVFSTQQQRHLSCSCHFGSYRALQQ